MESQVNLVDLVLMPLIAFIVGMLMVLLMRKIAARLQRRIGPPFFQPLYDIVKLHGKQTQISHGLIHEIGIVMAIGGYVAAVTLLPVPGMNGIELLAEIRERDTEIPVIIVTAHSSLDSAIDALRLGAIALVTGEIGSGKSTAIGVNQHTACRGTDGNAHRLNHTHTQASTTRKNTISKAANRTRNRMAFLLKGIPRCSPEWSASKTNT